jgi:3-oxoacyl-[acyl-carrier-protein] synthase-1
MTDPQIVLVDYEASCAAGTGLKALRKSLVEQNSGLRANDVTGSQLNTWVGRVAAADDHLVEDSERWSSRNNALIDVGLAQGQFVASLNDLRERFGEARIGVVMGSSTSSIDRSETAYQNLLEDGSLADEYIQEDVLNPHAPGLYVAEKLGLSGPNLTINTACSSSAKVFATASRWLQLGLVDAVLVGGADSLCLSVLHGFHSLQLVSEHPCRPFDQSRDGINLGEAAGFALLTRSDLFAEHKGIALTGYGESSDAHHMSHPHPEGEGARLALEQALAIAGLNSNDIDYINLHGTASQANDDIEGRLISRVFGSDMLASSTKGWMGHTLGAAGIMEAIIAFDAFFTGLIPGTLNLECVDEGINLSLSAENQSRPDIRHVMSNSFGFGGNNASLIFSRL